MKTSKYWIVIGYLLLLAACQPKSENVAPAEITERLSLLPEARGLMLEDTAHFQAQFFDRLGQNLPVPQGLLWSVENPSIAQISQEGIVKALATGQTRIKAQYMEIETTALLTVVSSLSEVATVEISPTVREFNLGEEVLLQATARNVLGEVLSTEAASWESAAPEIVSLNQEGRATALAYGSTSVKARIEGILSSAAEMQVVRRGQFGNGSVGTATLKIENGVLRLQTSSNFVSSSGAPDLRIYLGNEGSNVNGALELATLQQRTGGQVWNVPASVSITQYRYVLIWCKQFGGLYGVADLGNP